MSLPPNRKSRAARKMEKTVNPTLPGSNSRKIISIAAGEAHTLALTDDGKVYSWGRGTFGRLGTGSEEDRHFPVRVSFFGSDDERGEKLKIVVVAAGAYHSLALAGAGQLYEFGYGGLEVMMDQFGAGVTTSVSFITIIIIIIIWQICVFLDPDTDGQIGVGGENHLVPHLLEGFFGLGSPGSPPQDDQTKSQKSLKISSIEAGGMISLAIDDHGALWMWGNCPHPSQTSSSEQPFSLISSSSPLPVWNLHGHTVVKVACGNEHVIALVTAGETYKGSDLICYSWGNNNYGQLGLGDRENRSTPEIIEKFKVDSPWEVYDISCGASHTALLAKRKKPSEILESFCWTFGSGDNGQLGHGTTLSLESPEIVQDLPKSVFLVSVGCGLFHTSVVSSDGEIWSWGMEKGLGLCPDARFTGTDPGDALSPLLITPRKFQEPVRVACGGAHTVLVTDSGFKIWSWGRGRSGALGNGRTSDSYEPSLVLWPLLTDDFEGEGLKSGGQNEYIEEKAEMERVRVLESKLVTMERYAGVLHGSIFGKPLQEKEIPASFGNPGTFDIAREWENMLETLDQRGLVRLEMFYRDMRAGVKDKLLKRRVQEIMKECMESNATKDAE
ncbi:probable E3 ubiquitin-protein ligase herc4 [Phtheirospermum japonicum]|uniref:Probable E3 ubiquitin-protein ligase herc4 n=1 Tax=Phtheirospermum japonicum TaxID=374723 RepID=A0A830CAR4_9LAMI|nr:probable E3 ubiquitin-protein ligase herc4 [Phtheirospermum japonicum]